MLSFVSPHEMNEILNKDDRPVLAACLKKSTSESQKEVLEHISNIYGKTLKICLLDAEHIRVMKEKFDIHGFPAFVFCLRGKKKEVLLGHTKTEEMIAFIQCNLNDGSEA